MEKAKSKKKVIKIIIDVLFSVVMAFMAILITFSVIEKTTGISISGYHLVWVKTESMEPTIEKASYIITKDIDGKDVKVNDVITFVVNDPTSPINGQYNTHRVIEITSTDKLVTKGDNNAAQDAKWVDRSEVKAKYVRNVPFLTFFGRLFASTAGYVLSILLIIILIGAWFAIDIREKRKLKKEQLMNQMIEEEVKRLEEENKMKETNSGKD